LGTLNDGNVVWSYVTYKTNQLQLWWTRGKSGLNPSQASSSDGTSEDPEQTPNPEQMTNGTSEVPNPEPMPSENTDTTFVLGLQQEPNITMHLRNGASSASFSFFVIAMCTLMLYRLQ